MSFTPELRDKNLEIIYEAFNKYESFKMLSEDEKLECVGIYDTDCFEAASDAYEYMSYIYKLVSHLNENLIKRIINQEEDLIHLPSRKLDKEANKELLRDLRVRLKQKVDKQVLTDRKCPHCKHNESVSMQFQARGLDEMETFKRKCARCNLVWSI